MIKKHNMTCDEVRIVDPSCCILPSTYTHFVTHLLARVAAVLSATKCCLDAGAASTFPYQDLNEKKNAAIEVTAPDGESDA
jgi:hypothetical protein